MKIDIAPAEISDLECFFDYLGKQIAENGTSNSHLFQPLSRDINTICEHTRAKFESGFEATLGTPSWRKLWVAKDSLGNICGHIDLRNNGDEYRFHRVLLGMGVDSQYRKQRIGEQLIETAVSFCSKESSIDWLDLNVLSMNYPAKNLYLKCGFTVIGEIVDYYRIDGISVSELTMTKSVKDHQHH